MPALPAPRSARDLDRPGENERTAPRVTSITLTDAAPPNPGTGDSPRTEVTFAPATKVQPRPRPEISTAQFSRNRRSQAEAAPTIQVTIGRIEVRATPTPTQSPAERTAPAVMSLEEYLRQRNAQATNAHVAGGGSR